MTISNSIEKIAKQLDGSFKREDDVAFGWGFGNLHSSMYTIIFKHKGIEIKLTNEFGKSDLGEIKCNIPIQPKNCSFNLKAMNPWQQLFAREKSPITISSTNSQLKNYLESQDSFKDLTKAVSKQRFEPNMRGINSQEIYRIECNYHLLFDDQTSVILPLCKFFCDTIDFLLERKMSYS